MPIFKDLLKLANHIEGGYFAETFKSSDKVRPLNPRYQKDFSANHRETVSLRSAGTAIYFLLEHHGFSAFHKLKSDEVWHYYSGGSPIYIHIIDTQGELKTHVLGNPSITQNAAFQIVIPAGCWFAAEVFDKKYFGLVGCTVTPGFEYDDFELANRQELVEQYPDHKEIIKRFTYDTAHIENKSVTTTNNSKGEPPLRTIPSAIDYVKKLNLIRHPEGGYYAEVYRSSDQVIPLSSKYTVLEEKTTSSSEINIQRSAGTSIYYLLEKNDFSAFHRIKSDEIWHYYDGGSPILIHILNEEGDFQTQTLGDPTVTKGASFQVAVTAGCWFAAEVADKSAFGLVGCTVSPGFDFKDFELANRNKLISQYPKHQMLIEKFTRVESSEQKKTQQKIINSPEWNLNKKLFYGGIAVSLAAIGIYTLRNPSVLGSIVEEGSDLLKKLVFK